MVVGVVEAVRIGDSRGFGRSLGRNCNSREGYRRSAGRRCVRVGGIGAVCPDDRSSWVDFIGWSD